MNEYVPSTPKRRSLVEQLACAGQLAENPRLYWRNRPAERLRLKRYPASTQAGTAPKVTSLTCVPAPSAPPGMAYAARRPKLKPVAASSVVTCVRRDSGCAPASPLHCANAGDAAVAASKAAAITWVVF